MVILVKVGPRKSQSTHNYKQLYSYNHYFQPLRLSHLQISLGDAKMGKELVKCKHGANNVGDPFAVAVVKSGVPRQISTTYSVSLRKKKKVPFGVP